MIIVIGIDYCDYCVGVPQQPQQPNRYFAFYRVFIHFITFRESAHRARMRMRRYAVMRFYVSTALCLLGSDTGRPPPASTSNIIRRAYCAEFN